MTISSTANRNDYDGNGTTATYSYSFKIFNQSHLLVTVKNDTTLVETTLTLTTHYTVTGVNASSGGTIVLVAGSFDWLDGSNYLDTGYSLTIRRVVPLTQVTDIRNQGAFFPETHEDEFDLLMMAIQQQQDELDRSIKLPETSTNTGAFDTDVQADKAVYGNAAGTGFEFRTVTATSGSYPGGFNAGLDASKGASPSTNDVYIATDTKRVYVCFSSGTWTAAQLQSGADASKNASPLAGELYVATDTGKIYICKSAGTWVNQVVGIFNGLKGADIASASSIDLGAATGNYVDITGTTTITALGTADAGITRKVQFDGILTLTHNATSLILPSAANITTAAGDTAEFVSLGSGNWKCFAYTKADGTPIVTDALVSGDMPVGVAVAYSYTQSTANTASATNSPAMDDTVPTNTEVGVISTLTVSHTPKSATNILRIELFPNYCPTANSNSILALFKNSETDAIAATFMPSSDPKSNQFPPLVYHMVAGGTSAITFKMFGGTSGSTFTINAVGTTARMGSASIAYISVTEFVAS